MDTATTPAGDVVFVDRSTGDRGTKGRFFVAYTSAEAETRYGFCCEHCGAVDAAMDTMGRIECNVCGNVRKPEEWDAAHE
jgi:hypothetical protein